MAPVTRSMTRRMEATKHNALVRSVFENPLIFENICNHMHNFKNEKLVVNLFVEIYKTYLQLCSHLNSIRILLDNHMYEKDKIRYMVHILNNVIEFNKNRMLKGQVKFQKVVKDRVNYLYSEMKQQNLEHYLVSDSLDPYCEVVRPLCQVIRRIEKELK